ncbi:unnamed protein product [Caenorhabditis angaria]|uniref:Uncharacterized protein n=1 Tax=Caenorhabditis angaria TaxID=860376 RepID=A0A9P1IMJ2_9PELO|nr:unnamed protein product [Caenorhabditis angaria]
MKLKIGNALNVCSKCVKFKISTSKILLYLDYGNLPSYQINLFSAVSYVAQAAKMEKTECCGTEYDRIWRQFEFLPKQVVKGPQIARQPRKFDCGEAAYGKRGKKLREQ